MFAFTLGAAILPLMNPASSWRQYVAAGGVVFASLAGLATGSSSAAAASTAAPATTPAVAREDHAPRKVLLGTVVGGYEVYKQPLAERFGLMDALVDQIASEARNRYPGKRLDLVVLPEFFLAQPGTTLAQKTVRLEDVRQRIGACAKQHGCYLVVPLLMREETPPLRYSNAAVLVDRSGIVQGIYRKVHPVAPQQSDNLEDGTSPGREFPVFDCDFGRVGIQICFDMSYDDGWTSLARQGAEIVALPSASPGSARPSAFALQHNYYIISATPRDRAAVFSPLGLIEAQATQEGTVLVHQIDLSYALLNWEEVLEDGQALSRRFGDKVGFHYYRAEDEGIFWSNDDAMSIGQMIRSLGLTGVDANLERIRALQDRVRGGPPVQ